MDALGQLLEGILGAVSGGLGAGGEFEAANIVSAVSKALAGIDFDKLFATLTSLLTTIAGIFAK